MKKITVKVCLGTACFVMGGSDMQLLHEHLPESWKDKVEVVGASCLDYCFDKSNGTPPFVVVDDQIVSEANITKVIDIIKLKLEQ